MRQPFIPENLPLEGIDANRFVGLLCDANRALSGYDGIVRNLINPDILLSPFLVQEAVLSSKIEGTQATVDEVYEREAGVNFGEGKNLDISEIINYRSALRFAAKSIQDRPLSLGMIKEIHGLLLNGVRGSNKTPGLFRKEQNWIGKPGSSLEQAIYIPPPPIIVESSLDNLLTYLQGEHIDILVQTAVMHAQFEIIHPFLDGNGRIGRLMIPLYLYAKGVLYRPMFYMSSYFESNREEYYHKLNDVHQKGDWTNWIIFFLSAIKEQARENTRRALAINRLYNELLFDFRNTTHSEHSQPLLYNIFESPIFTKPQVIKKMDCPEVTARNLLNLVIKANLVELVRKGGGRKPDLFTLSPLIKIASGLPIGRFEY